MAASSPDFLPTASLAALRVRAELLDEVRRFFRERDYLEVETPVLSRDIVVDAHLDPFVVPGAAAHPHDLFLQTSPEFHMKRLLAAGAPAIFQVARVMRRGELGRLHNPEFTMIEWYRVGDTHVEQMECVEALVRAVFDRARSNTRLAPGPAGRERARDQPASAPQPDEVALGIRPFPRLTYDEAFERFASTRVLTLPAAELVPLAARHGVAAPPGLAADDRDGWLNLILAAVVEPHLGRDGPTFLCDYPASQAALAKVRMDDPPVAERFELYVDGIELCNGYHELTDAAELRRRMQVQAALRAREGHRPLPMDNRLLAAMEAGLPACAGVALGFDRLVMLAAGKSSLAEVVAFPFERA